MKPVAFLDIEILPGWGCITFKRHSDGKYLCFQIGDGIEFKRDAVLRTLRDYTIVSFNGINYDMPVVWAAVNSKPYAEVVQISNRIIHTRARPWEIEREYGLRTEKIDHIDLFEPNPSVRSSLKTLAGRLHAPTMQEFPVDFNEVPTQSDREILLAYNRNDLDVTQLLYEALEEPIKLREQLGAVYGEDFRSKSDAQIGEAIVKKRCEFTGRADNDRHMGSMFIYDVPPWVRFETPRLRRVLDIVRNAKFRIGDGVEFPKEFKEPIVIGGSTYSLGIGGLHSTESDRALHSDAERVLIDADVASQYPSIIRNLGLYPPALGTKFCDVYAALITERIAAKKAGNKVADKGLKIALNGTYGKLGSPYSALFAPHLMLATTLTGQLSLLMLIERAELAGVPVVSGNTDGVVFHAPREFAAEIVGSRLQPCRLAEITEEWERITGFTLEFATYESLYSASVNCYFALKSDGKAKRKGPLGNPWKEGDLRESLMKNPQMTICADAALQFLIDGTPIEKTIRDATDPRQFVTVVNVKGGGSWRGEYLGKVVRFYWSKDGDPITYIAPHPTTGNYRRVANTEGAKPMMVLPESLPADVDYEHYIEAARDILMSVGWRPKGYLPPAPMVYLRGLKALIYLAMVD